MPWDHHTCSRAPAVPGGIDYFIPRRPHSLQRTRRAALPALAAGGVLLAFDFDGTLARIAATSVGITARVLKDADALRSGFARIILGAPVIDDVLGLLVLAVVLGIIKAAATGEALSAGAIALIIASIVHRDHAHDRHAPGLARCRLRRRAYLSHIRMILHPGR